IAVREVNDLIEPSRMRPGDFVLHVLAENSILQEEQKSQEGWTGKPAPARTCRRELVFPSKRLGKGNPQTSASRTRPHVPGSGFNVARRWPHGWSPLRPVLECGAKRGRAVLTRTRSVSEVRPRLADASG